MVLHSSFKWIKSHFLSSKSWQKGVKKSHPQSGAKEQGQRIIFLPPLGIGFGNLTATAENIQPGSEETKGPDGAEIFVKAATNCCGTCCNYCCCMCCIQAFTRINNQCAIAFTQLCVGLGCFSCINCCADICCSGNENWNVNICCMVVVYYIEISVYWVVILEMYMLESSVLFYSSFSCHNWVV